MLVVAIAEVCVISVNQVASMCKNYKRESVSAKRILELAKSIKAEEEKKQLAITARTA